MVHCGNGLGGGVGGVGCDVNDSGNIQPEEEEEDEEEVVQLSLVSFTHKEDINSLQYEMKKKMNFRSIVTIEEKRKAPTRRESLKNIQIE